MLNLNGKISETNSDSLFYELFLTNNNVNVIKQLHSSEVIEKIRDSSSQIISVDSLTEYLNQTILIELVKAELERIGFYFNFSDFISANRFEEPDSFYILEFDYHSTSKAKNNQVEKYRAILEFLSKLISISKFTSDDFPKTLYIIQDNSFLELNIKNKAYEYSFESTNIKLLKKYIESIDSYMDKKTIFIKELIDFLSSVSKSKRISYLFTNFREFYERCDTSLEYYLSNFSFNKLKLEIDSSVLEYSKNVRSIINDSQSKLIAIPAAFVFAISQVNFSQPFTEKNIFIVLSSFLFSYIISIFIRNQQNSLEIVEDNLNNYKINSNHSLHQNSEDENELNNLTSLIKSSFKKIEKELEAQNKRLKILQFCNWGISIVLATTLCVAIISNIEFHILVIYIQCILFH